MPSIKDLNKLKHEKLKELLLNCCGSHRWVEFLIEHRPYRDLNDLVEKSNQIWYYVLDKEDWKEAFSHHPQIGDLDTLKEKYSQNKEWSSNEQKSVTKAREEILEELASKNEKYLSKFGYIFIIFATGKSAKQMLNYLNLRLNNNPKQEILIASREQNKITRLRLSKLVNMD